MSTAFIIGWIANLLFIYGVWVIGNKNIKGFYASAVANALYVYQSTITNNNSLFWLSLFLICINLRGIYLWQFKTELK